MSSEIELAILFADLVGSTKLYNVMGDLKARELVAGCLDVLRAVTEQHGGTVIKTIGDEVMSTFPTADAAIDAAIEMQEVISTRGDLKILGQPAAIRIGCHYGPVVPENRDVFGAAVHTASRLTNQAKARQIVTTGVVVDRLTPERRTAARQIDVALLRGVSSEVVLYEILWQPEDVTSMAPAIEMRQRGDGKRARLRLRHREQEVLVEDGHVNVTMGRAEDNDLVVKGELISRLHARIERSRDKFTLIDQSTNGTFVRTDAGEEAFIRRDSIPLKGSGAIGLGKAPEGDEAIRFVSEG
jgi:class 3 adenylate cyclase